MFNNFSSEVLQLQGVQECPVADDSEASVQGLFDVLQNWALDFAQNVLEPIQKQLHLPHSELDTTPVFRSFLRLSFIDDCLKVHDSPLELSQAQHDALQQAHKQSPEAKTLSDVSFVLSNVSFCVVFLCLSAVTVQQVERAIFRCQAVFAAAPGPDITSEQLLKLFESAGCLHQVLEKQS